VSAHGTGRRDRPGRTPIVALVPALAEAEAEAEAANEAATGNGRAASGGAESVEAETAGAGSDTVPMPLYQPRTRRGGAGQPGPVPAGANVVPRPRDPSPAETSVSSNLGPPGGHAGPAAGDTVSVRASASADGAGPADVAGSTSTDVAGSTPADVAGSTSTESAGSTSTEGAGSTEGDAPPSLTHLGLPVRVRQAGLAPGLRAGAALDPVETSPLPPRSAEEIRQMMTAYQLGTVRGRRAIVNEVETSSTIDVGDDTVVDERAGEES
jgi:hypothetical protein